MRRGVVRELTAADLLAREVVLPGTWALRRIVDAFARDVQDKTGENVLLADGTLNRKALGAAVFADPVKLRRLNAITGPAIFVALLRRMLWHWTVGTPLVFIDAPTLFESGGHIARVTAQVVVVACDPETQLRRIVGRDGLSHEAALQRVQSQFPLDAKRARADVVIENTGARDDLLARVDGLVANVRRRYDTALYRLFSGPGLACAAAAAAAVGWALLRVRTVS